MLQKIFISLLLVFSANIIAYAKNDDKNTKLEYEIEGAGTGEQGTYLVNVTVISPKLSIDDHLIARCAVHGVLFRGFSSKELRQSQRPLAGSAAVEAQHANFFNDFFSENGLAKNYVSQVNGSRKVVKSGKVYKISTIVTVNKSQLQRDLEAVGVIKGLNSGF